MFMVSAGVFTALFEYPQSALQHTIANADIRRMFIGIAMGMTAVGLIYSPWGQRSGAHMNPAVTLSFWQLSKVAHWDAVFYIVAQFVGGTLGVYLTIALLHNAFTAPPVDYIVTVPGSLGTMIAFVAELVMSALLMFIILHVSNSQRYAKYTGWCAGILVALYITIEAPLSGMSINPARSFASAWPAHQWLSFWIYLTAPMLGMQGAAAWYLAQRGQDAVGCAKLLHPAHLRCIHCGHVPMNQSILDIRSAGELQ